MLALTWPEIFVTSFRDNENEDKNLFLFVILNLKWKGVDVKICRGKILSTSIPLRQPSERIPEMIIMLNIAARIRYRRLLPVFIAAAPIARVRRIKPMPSLVSLMERLKELFLIKPSILEQGVPLRSLQ
jgi:hypothetical protein